MHTFRIVPFLDNLINAPNRGCALEDCSNLFACVRDQQRHFSVLFISWFVFGAPSFSHVLSSGCRLSLVCLAHKQNAGVMSERMIRSNKKLKRDPFPPPPHFPAAK